jgi:hypothetical protein
MISFSYHLTLCETAETAMLNNLSIKQFMNVLVNSSLPKDADFICQILKLLFSKLTPRSGEALGRVETAPASVVRTQGRPQAVVSRRSAAVPLASQLLGMSRDGKTHLQILCQPEQQHRARYQTEGSRGAVKDRSGNGFPVVKVISRLV